MSARELDALTSLRDAERLLVNHRSFVRARPRGELDARNAEEHERVTQAIHRTREAIAHLVPLELVCSCGRELETRSVCSVCDNDE